MEHPGNKRPGVDEDTCALESKQAEGTGSGVGDLTASVPPARSAVMASPPVLVPPPPLHGPGVEALVEAARVYVVGMKRDKLEEYVHRMESPDGVRWETTATSAEGWTMIDPVFTES